MNVPRAGGMTIARAQVLGRQLKAGMTADEVKAILGEPDDNSDRKTDQDLNATAPRLRWFYRWKVFIGYRLELVFERRADEWVLTSGDWWNG